MHVRICVKRIIFTYSLLNTVGIVVFVMLDASQQSKSLGAERNMNLSRDDVDTNSTTNLDWRGEELASRLGVN